MGRVLAASTNPRLGYLWEPFNPRHRPGTFPVRFPRYFEYLCAENGRPYVEPMSATLAFRYRPGAELRSLRSPRDAARMGRDWARFGLGVRVPMLIISPWAKRGVIHTTYDFTSVLKFIDQDFGMPILSRREQQSNSIRTAFQFSHPLPRWQAPQRNCPPVSAAELAATGRNIDPS